MLRFRSKNKYCINKDVFKKENLKAFFLGSKKDIVILVDETDKYVGYVSYKLYLNKEIDLKEDMNKEYVILDDSLWEKAHLYFKKNGNGKHLPVLNNEHHLLYILFQDEEADRELRMLDELMRCKNALCFRDVFSEYNSVIIHGFNELAYCFARYLSEINITVKVSGRIWEYFDNSNIENITYEKVIDDDCYEIFGEGLRAPEEDSLPEKSVSVEFECIDKIYEENIRKGIIKDKEGNVKNIIEKIRNNPIAILGTGEEAIDAWWFLQKNGLDVCCFIGLWKTQGNNMLGKNICSREEVIKSSEKMIIINPNSKYSAWGFGGVDYYHYWGFKRNESFFLLQDYVEISHGGLYSIVKESVLDQNRRLVLLGDIRLCYYMYLNFEDNTRKINNEIVYCDLFSINKKTNMLNIQQNQICDNDICLLLLPEYYGCYKDNKKSKARYKIWQDYLDRVIDIRVKNALSYIPLQSTVLMEKMKESEQPHYKVNKIMIGAINYYSGNTIFRELLDNYPNVVMLDYGYLNDNLYSICIRLSTEKRSDIIAAFWEIYNTESIDYVDAKEEFPNVELFNKTMRKMLMLKEVFSSQELFIMIHIAYAMMWGQDIEDISKVIIFWEPHAVLRDECENYAEWLNGACEFGYIINMVRDACKRAGSCLKNLLYSMNREFQYPERFAYTYVLNYPNGEKKEYPGWKRIVIRFEDLKCNPKKELLLLCDALEIDWSDTLLETTWRGKESYYEGITGFDLRPVYTTYNEYFSTFDIFRISLITAPWQRKYKYPYTDSLDFNRRELRDMFEKKWRFDGKISHKEDEEVIRVWVQKMISECLWMTRRNNSVESWNNYIVPSKY